MSLETRREAFTALSGSLCHFQASEQGIVRKGTGAVIEEFCSGGLMPAVRCCSGSRNQSIDRKGYRSCASKLLPWSRKARSQKENQNSARPLPLHSANACFSCNVRSSHLEITASILNSSVSLSTDRVSAMYWLLIHSAACLVQSSLVQ